MIRICTLLAGILGVSLAAVAQPGLQPFQRQGLALDFASHYIGKNLNLTYRQQLSRGWGIYGGLKYHLNGEDMPDSKRLFWYKRLHAGNQSQRLGLKLGLERALYRNLYTELFAFYDLQFTRSTYRSGNYYTSGEDSLGQSLWIYNVFVFSPITTFENQIGVGARMRVTDRFFVKGGISGGAALMLYGQFDQKHQTQIVGNGKDFEFTRMFTIGLEYRIR